MEGFECLEKSKKVKKGLDTQPSALGSNRGATYFLPYKAPVPRCRTVPCWLDCCGHAEPGGEHPPQEQSPGALHDQQLPLTSWPAESRDRQLLGTSCGSWLTAASPAPSPS